MSKARDIADLDFNSPDIDGGNIDGAVIGATTAAAGDFTSVGVAGVGANPASSAHAPAIITSGSYGGGLATVDTNESGWYQISNGANWVFYHNKGSSDSPSSKNVLEFNSSGNATFAGTVEVGGTLYIPQWIEHSGDSNTYFGFVAGDEFKIVTGNTGRLHIKGAETVFNEGGEDKNFRVESNNNENMFIVDGGSDTVKIGHIVGSQTPATLHIRKNGANLEFGHGNNSAGYFGTLGAYGNNGHPYIGFSTNAETNANTFATYGAKGSIVRGDLNGRTIFETVDTASATGQTPIERMRIGPADTVINDSSHDYDFRVESNSHTHALFVDGGNDRVGVFESAPSVKFHVLGTSNDTISETNANVQFEGAGGNGLAFGTQASSGQGYASYIQSGYVNDFSTAVYNLKLNPLGGKTIFGGDVEFSAIATYGSMGNVSIAIPDRAATLYNIGDRGNITIQASSSTSGGQALSGGRVLINAGNSNNGQTGDVVISTGVNILNSNDKGNVRFNIGGRTSSEEVAKIDRFGLEVSGRKLCNSDNSAPSGVSGGLVYSTPAYDEYHYVYSGNQTRTLDLVCGSYFMAEVTYTSHQTNGGADIHRHIKGKWANNHQTHTFVNYNDSGNTNAISLTITATDQYGGSNDASGRLRIRQTYSSGSYAGTRVIVRVYYGAISSATMSSV